MIDDGTQPDCVNGDANGFERQPLAVRIGDELAVAADEAAIMVWVSEGGGQRGSGAPFARALPATRPNDTDAALVRQAAYAAYEADFRLHHLANAAGRRGSYAAYRLVYRYGYELGTDVRYRDAAWSQVEHEARLRWEERNPNTWAQFKDIIRYAWEHVRRQP